MKIESLICGALNNANSTFRPGDPITWNNLEVKRGEDLTFQGVLEGAVREAGEASQLGADGNLVGDGTQLNLLSHNLYLKIFFELRLIAKYFAGEFRLRCSREDAEIKKEFYQIWELFIEKWYFSYVYVGYGEDLLELDKRLIRHSKQSDTNVFEHCKFRLYTKSGEKFYSVIAGSVVESKLVNKDRLVRCSLDENTIWLCWWHILLEAIGGVNRCLSAYKAISKQIVMSNFNKSQVQGVMDQIDNNRTVFMKPASLEEFGEPTFCKPMKFMDSNDVYNMFGMMYDYIERKASQLGYVFKPANLKKERTNSGENFAINKCIFNMQTTMLNSLNSCIFSFQKKFGKVIPEDLQVVLSNQAWALGNPVPPTEEQQEMGEPGNFGQGWLRNGRMNPKNIENFKDAH